MTKTLQIPIDNIIVPNSRREIEQAKVTELAESIRQVGLINPVTITSDYRLVAGTHRLEACKRLGQTEIAYSLLEGNPLQIELAEIDENLIRNELDPIRMGELAIRRDEILESLGQRAKNGDNRFTNRGAESAPLKTTKAMAQESV
jgi:ParB-like chromosome segregation protein Spo0J